MSCTHVAGDRVVLEWQLVIADLETSGDGDGDGDGVDVDEDVEDGRWEVETLRVADIIEHNIFARSGGRTMGCSAARLGTRN